MLVVAVVATARTLQTLDSVFAETVAARGSFFSSASSPK